MKNGKIITMLYKMEIHDINKNDHAIMLLILII